MMYARHHFGKLFGAVIAVAALSLVTPGAASADATDDAFLTNLFSHGVNFSQPEQIVKRARTVCEAFASGKSPATIHQLTLNDSAFTPRQAAVFMADAVQAYCPKYSDQFMS